VHIGTTLLFPTLAESTLQVRARSFKTLDLSVAVQVVQASSHGMPGYVTIKTGFNVIFSNLLFKRVVQNAVNAVPPILIATHLFATFHVTRLLEAGQSLGTLDQTFYNRCTAAVTTAIDGSEPLDLQGLADPRHAKHDSKAGQQFSDLNTSLVDFNAALPAGHRGPIVWHACPHHCTVRHSSASDPDGAFTSTCLRLSALKVCANKDEWGSTSSPLIRDLTCP